MPQHDAKKILVFTDWYLPGYKAGGPIRSVANLVRRLDLDWSVVTSNTDHNEIEPYPDIEPNKWMHGSQNERVIYLSNENQTRKKIRALIREYDYDYFYINSLFSVRFALTPLRVLKQEGKLNQTILAPRGMLKPGALSVKSRKKSTFLKVAKAIGLYKGITWHATNLTEKTEIVNHFGEVQVKIAPNLVILPKEMPPFPKKNARTLRVVSVARVSPEKNTLGAIQAFVKAFGEDDDVQFDLYGTLQDEEYLRECREVARALGNKIDFKGPIHSSEIAAILKSYHLFFLPTLGENFGHAIMESLMFATPVLISNTTPWRGLKNHGAGWDLPIEEEQFGSKLQEIFEMEEGDYHIMCQGAYDFTMKTHKYSGDVKKSYQLFNSIRRAE